MATITFIRYQKQSAGSLQVVSRYVSQKEKVQDMDGRQLVSGQNCTPQLSVQEFLATRDVHRKDSPIWFYHYVQSFSPEEQITGEQAHQLAREFAAQAWPDNEVLIATHLDTEHIHSHFIVNAVCFESGRMLRQGPNTLRALRQLSDGLYMVHGFSVLPKEQKKQTQGMTTREYRSAVKGQSWKFRLMTTIDQCMKFAATREEFISLIESEGYQVRWTDSRKNITYTTPEGMKCRDDRLHETKYTKEVMEREFRVRAEIVRGRTETAEPAADYTRTDNAAEQSYAAGLERSVGSTRCSVPTGEHQQRPAGAPGSQRWRTGGPAAGDLCPGGEVSHPSPTGGAGAGCGPDPRDIATGWEETRAEFLAAQDFPVKDLLAQSPGLSLAGGPAWNPDSGLPGSGGLDLFLQMGYALESLQDHTPIIDGTTTPYYTDRKLRRREKAKKIAMGQNPKDHEDPQLHM